MAVFSFDAPNSNEYVLQFSLMCAILCLCILHNHNVGTYNHVNENEYDFLSTFHEKITWTNVQSIFKVGREQALICIKIRLSLI